MPPPGIEPATPCFLACPSNHLAIGRDIDMSLELLQYFLIKRYYKNYGSVPVDFLRSKFRVAHTKHDVINILMNKYTYINMYIIKKIISCIFILCWDITALLKLKWKFAGYV